jgi:hypothetical protein
MLITAEKRIKENTHVYNASVKYGMEWNGIPVFWQKCSDRSIYISKLSSFGIRFIRFSIGAREATEKI